MLDVQSTMGRKKKNITKSKTKSSTAKSKRSQDRSTIQDKMQVPSEEPEGDELSDNSSGVLGKRLVEIADVRAHWICNFTLRPSTIS